jgi:hypothetical protein
MMIGETISLSLSFIGSRFFVLSLEGEGLGSERRRCTTNHSRIGR